MNKLAISLLSSLLLACLAWGALFILVPRVSLLQMDRYPYSMKILLVSDVLLHDVLQLDPNNVWANIAMSEARLHEGYKAGSLFEQDNYQPQFVAQAYDYALKAVAQGADNSRSYAQLAKLQIIRREYRTAWDTLNKAHDLDPNSYYAWYYLTALNRYYRLYDKAEHYADRAMSEARFTFQRRSVIDQLVSIAIAEGNIKKEEGLYLKVIKLDPDRAYSYGNYATFLYDHKRYREAVTYFEKAISIAPYPIAEDLLRKAKEKLQQAPMAVSASG